MKTIQTYDEFLNEGKFGRALAGAALGAGLLMGSPAMGQTNQKIGTEQTISKEVVETKVAVSNLVNCDYKYDGYDMNSDGTTSIYFTKDNTNVVLDCTLKQKWNGKNDFIKFIIKNSILK